MDSCTEQMLEMEQPDDVYRLGRALRGVYPTPAGDDAVAGGALLARLDDADRATAAQPAEVRSLAADV